MNIITFRLAILSSSHFLKFASKRKWLKNVQAYFQYNLLFWCNLAYQLSNSVDLFVNWRQAYKNIWIMLTNWMKQMFHCPSYLYGINNIAYKSYILYLFFYYKHFPFIHFPLDMHIKADICPFCKKNITKTKIENIVNRLNTN